MQLPLRTVCRKVTHFLERDPVKGPEPDKRICDAEPARTFDASNKVVCIHPQEYQEIAILLLHLAILAFDKDQQLF